MSGLLRRLARQTIDGGAPLVHSSARLPFAGAPRAEMSVPDSPDPAVTPDPVSSVQLVAQSLSSASIATGAEADGGSRIGGRASRVIQPVKNDGHSPMPDASEYTVAQPPPSRGLSSTQTTEATEATEATARGAVGDMPFDDFTRDDAAIVRRDSLPSKQPPSKLSRAIEPEAVAKKQHGDSLPVAERQAVIGHLESPLLPEIPPLLLAPVAPDSSHRVVPSVQADQTRVRRDSRRQNEPDEVHVHIGRVEVTAVHEPAPAQPKDQVNTKQPMSLDDYLAQRERSRK